MRIVRLLMCGSYWLFLTVLLLVPNPAAVVGLRKVPTFPWGDIGIHFTAFTILALVVHFSRWPKSFGWTIVVLLAYGIATESLQYFVPPRCVELKDYIENILGIAFGSGVFWWLSRVLSKARPDHVSSGASRPAIALDAANQ